MPTSNNTLKIKASAIINAAPDRIWRVITEDDQWIRSFTTISGVTSDWQEGHRIIFHGHGSDGLIGQVAVRTRDKIQIMYTGLLTGDLEDYSSDDALQVAGKHEVYEVRQQGNQAMLLIEADVEDPHHDDTLHAWRKALQIIKRLSESDPHSKTP